MGSMVNNVRKGNTSEMVLSTKETNNWRKVFADNNEKVFHLLEEFLGIEESQGMGKQVNRGKLAEMWLQKDLGLIPDFDKINDWDFTKDSQKIQFKYLGQNSSPSVSELKRENNEGMVKFVNRVMKHYQNCNLFAISLENYISHIKWENCIILTKEEFKVILRAHDKNVKFGNKLRLRKTVVKKVLNEKFGR